MLPRIDTNGGRRGSRRDVFTHRSGAEAAVVPLPRLRLLKQVGGGESTVLAPPSLEKMAAPPPRRLLLSRANSGETDSYRAGSDSLQPVPRGRGLLRPLDDRGQALLSQPPRSRSPPPMSRNEDELPQDDSPQENVSALLQQRARVRVKEQRRQRRRAAKEEEERRQQDEQERMDRVQRSAGQIEAHRRELARHAAERARRSREDREDRAQEREELQSDRRERMRRYQTPAQIRELRRLENNHRSSSPGSHAEADSDGKNTSIPRRAERAPSPEVQEVRERRRGSRGRAPNRHGRKASAADVEQPVEDVPSLKDRIRHGEDDCKASELEVVGQHETRAACQPDTSKIQELREVGELRAVAHQALLSAAASGRLDELLHARQAVHVEVVPQLEQPSKVTEESSQEACSPVASRDNSEIRRQLRQSLEDTLCNGELERAVHLL